MSVRPQGIAMSALSKASRIAIAKSVRTLPLFAMSPICAVVLMRIGYETDRRECLPIVIA